jgi:hypothetical protein
MTHEEFKEQSANCTDSELDELCLYWLKNSCKKDGENDAEKLLDIVGNMLGI